MAQRGNWFEIEKPWCDLFCGWSLALLFESLQEICNVEHNPAHLKYGKPKCWKSNFWSFCDGRSNVHWEIVFKLFETQRKSAVFGFQFRQQTLCYISFQMEETLPEQLRWLSSRSWCSSEMFEWESSLNPLERTLRQESTDPIHWFLHLLTVVFVSSRSQAAEVIFPVSFRKCLKVDARMQQFSSSKKWKFQEFGTKTKREPEP